MTLIFDTETTGLPAKGQYDNPLHPDCPRMVELAAVLFADDFHVTATLENIIRPEGFAIPDVASHVHGITTERAIVEGAPLRDVIDAFDLMRCSANLLVSHNMQYDWLILRKEYLVLEEQIPSTLVVMNRFCTKDAMTSICRLPGFRGQFKWPTLQEAYRHFFSEDFSGAHGALADVMACARVYFYLKHNHDLGPYTPSK